MFEGVLGQPQGQSFPTQGNKQFCYVCGDLWVTSGLKLSSTKKLTMLRSSRGYWGNLRAEAPQYKETNYFAIFWRYWGNLRAKALQYKETN